MTHVARARPSVPAYLSPYVDILGVDLAVTFFLRFGGSEIYLPMYAEQGARQGEVVNLIGFDNMKSLGEMLGQVKTRVPLANEWIARTLAWKGQPVAAISRQIRVSDNTVRGWLRADKQKRAATPRDT